MPLTAVAHYLYLLDEAFEGPAWHSLLGNLRSVAVGEDDWLWVPPGGRRSIRDIVQHVAGAKIMYHNHAFGDGQLAWTDPSVDNWERVATMEQAVDWLREGHTRLRESVAALQDDELLALRRSPSDKQKETRRLISILIQHDLYHAGEINHIRALRQGDDE